MSIALDYTVLLDCADKRGLPYNELCSIVHKATAIPQNAEKESPAYLEPTKNIREAFEETVSHLFVTDSNSFARTLSTGGVYYSTVRSKTYDGRRSAYCSDVKMMWELWMAARDYYSKRMKGN